MFTRYDENKASMLAENQEKQQEQLFNVALKLTGKNLETMARDYSLWDKMFRFVHSKNIKWGVDNIIPGMPTLGALSTWVYTTDLSLVYSYNIYNDNSLKELPLNKNELLAQLKNNGLVIFLRPHQGDWIRAGDG